ncbi:MAG: FAD-dependent oxidoreductase, partial [Desulfobacterales bacterium]|nr:FAD-dependent oxidoreductase [Desulfobacterales bacterium]
MQKRLVLIGAGHAHMVTLKNLQQFVERGYAVTVIGPSEDHYYSGMGPGMLGKTYRPEEIRFAVKKMTETRGGTFIKGKAQSLDPDRKLVRLEDGHEIPYDVASCNAGSYVPGLEGLDESANIFAVKPIERLQRAQKKIIELGENGSGRIAIIGGGASSVEVAGNVVTLLQKHNLKGVSVQIFAGKG